jgi:dihydrofolate reductase
MGNLIYSAITSLDGYIVDAEGDFEWAAPDEEVHAFVNDLERPVGTYLYGRRMYETMAVWDDSAAVAGWSAASEDFAAIWQAAEKVVYSRTLETASTRRTRIERDFDPEAVRQLKEAADRDLTIGGAEIAGQALAAGVVDEVQLFLTPILVGGGSRALPDGVRVALELLDERRFAGGVVYLRYASAPSRSAARWASHG